MLDLFSGIGGFSLAARWTGQIETVAFCEIDPFCQKVLKKHWPTVPIISDIREVTGERIRGIVVDTGDKQRRELSSKGIQSQRATSNQQQFSDVDSERDKSNIDILAGGFPCQPFSCAGKRKGTSDNRFLWPEMLRVIKEVRPRWVIGENVAGLISIDNGMVFEDCCASLEAEGYAVQSFILPACAVGAPHRRDRVWIVANAVSRRCRAKWECGSVEAIYRRGQNDPMQTEKSDSYAPDTEHTTPPRYGQDGRGILPVAESIRPNNGNQWNEDWYSVALRTCVRDLDDGLPGRLAGRGRVNKLKALGNSVVPAIPYQIMMAILEVENA